MNKIMRENGDHYKHSKWIQLTLMVTLKNIETFVHSRIILLLINPSSIPGASETACEVSVDAKTFS